MRLDSVSKIWYDDSLYGHSLTSFPSKVWDFATSNKLYSYVVPDEGSTKVIRLIFEKYLKTVMDSEGNIIRTDKGKNNLLLMYAEIGFRRIAGTLLYTGSIITAAPLGFAIKVIHNTFKRKDAAIEPTHPNENP